jgi:tripartite-type tricarboxylate transporter receptor subunit TctC
VPTLDESGVKGYEALTWTGIFAPAGTPAPVVEKLSVSLGKALTHPTVRERFGGMGVEIMDLGQAEFAAYVARRLRQVAARRARGQHRRRVSGAGRRHRL